MSSMFDRRIEPGLNAPSKKIEPGLDAAHDVAGTWWYQNAGVGIGPVTEGQMQALVSGKVVDRATMVWRNEFGVDWKRLDETALWMEPAGPPAFDQPVKPKWQKAFKAAAELEGTWSLVNRTGTRRSMGERMKAQWTLFSIPAFFFGPFYYFYMRMWQKGLVLVAVVLVTSVIDGLFDWSKGFSYMVWMFCAVHVKQDYFRLRTKDEVMWPGLDVFKNIYVDVGATAAAAALFVGVAYVEGGQDDASGIAPTKAVAETTAGSPAAKVSRVATKTSVSVSEPEELQSGTISVEATPDFKGSSDGSTYDIVVTSKVDGIIVSGIEVNRGNCNAQLFNPGLKHFGEIANGWAACKPIELKVLTNSGTGKFSFDD